MNTIGDKEAAAISDSKTQNSEVHIRMQKRNGRKCITTLVGLNVTFNGRPVNFDTLNKHFKKVWGCNGIVVDDPESGKVIQLQGDQRDNLKAFLIAERLAKEKDLRVYGI